MNRITQVIFGEDTQVKSILRDELSLFTHGSILRVDEILPEKSKIEFNRLISSLTKHKCESNMKIEVSIKDNLVPMFFTGIYWMEYYIVCISEEKISESCVQEEENLEKWMPALESVHTHKDDIHEFNEISRLNYELLQIQHELTAKNINLSSLIGRLEELATTDPLTGIFNRRAILERAETEIYRASREGRHYGMAILDLDDFKRINDQFGHQMGDRALMTTSACLRESTRQYDAAGRIGGDEFLVFFSVDSKEQFRKILKRLLNEINQRSMDISGELTIRIKASIGAIYVNAEKQNKVGITTLMKKADDALYNAKDDGGNTIRIEEY